jgi:hypothetical protein
VGLQGFTAAGAHVLTVLTLGFGSAQVQISATEAMRHEYDSARKDVASAR